MAVLVVLTTAPNASSARKIAEGLVRKRLAACVTVLKGAFSVYRWRGKIEKAPEVQLLIKTTEGKFQALRRWMEKKHPYESPEIIGWRVSVGSAKYLSWINH
ncbi:MAG: divalent-cation tolerance protein CutA [Candidatus Omnitrophica bacterium]|nr:divalent-cation tolerance protein CutA [Candidatus Omnitrophota bacterium]